MFRLPPLTPFVKKLLIALFGTYLAQVLVTNWGGVPLFNLLALDAANPGTHSVWQIFTHVFAADTRPHYVLSMLIALVFLWWMLAPFEERFGERRTFQLCLAATLGAAIPAALVGPMLPDGGPVFGSQPLLLAAIAAFAWSYRGRGQLSLFGVFEMKAEHLLWLTIGLSVLLFLSSKNWLALVADLGGIGAGVAFIEWLRRPPRKKRTSDLRVISGSRPPKDTWLN